MASAFSSGQLVTTAQAPEHRMPIPITTAGPYVECRAEHQRADAEGLPQSMAMCKFVSVANSSLA